MGCKVKTFGKKSEKYSVIFYHRLIFVCISPPTGQEKLLWKYFFFSMLRFFSAVCFYEK